MIQKWGLLHLDFMKHLWHINLSHVKLDKTYCNSHMDYYVTFPQIHLQYRFQSQCKMYSFYYTPILKHLTCWIEFSENVNSLNTFACLSMHLKNHWIAIKLTRYAEHINNCGHEQKRDLNSYQLETGSNAAYGNYLLVMGWIIKKHTRYRLFCLELFDNPSYISKFLCQK